MSKMVKTIATLGVVAGLGISAMPLSAYALEDSETVNLNVQVGEMIEIAAEKTNIDLGEVSNTQNATGSTKIKVRTNVTNGYTATIRATDASLKTADTVNSIPGIKPQTGVSGWGYKIGSITDIMAATTGDTQFANVTSITPPTTGSTNGDEYDLGFEVSVAPNQPAGTYSGSVILTATANASSTQP